MNDYINFVNVCKRYDYNGGYIMALDNINFNISKGEVVVIVGASGAGKSTALNILGGMDTATSGEVYVDGNKITSYSDEQLTQYRRNDIGFVFQFYNLIQNLSVFENVAIGSEIVSNPLPAKEILDRVGLSDRLNNFPGQISGGEQQRTAIARAIAKRPKILLCDEPTGALDYVTGKQILKLLLEINKTYGITVIIITHNYALSSLANKVISFKSGKIECIKSNDNPSSIEDIEW